MHRPNRLRRRKYLDDVRKIRKRKIIRKVDIFQFNDFMQEFRNKEERERLEEFLDFAEAVFLSVKLANKTVHLYKPLLLNSKITEYLMKDECNQFNSFKFDIEDTRLLYFQIGLWDSNQTVNIEQCTEYFFFFNSIGDKVAMANVLTRIYFRSLDKPVELQQYYRALRTAVERFEDSATVDFLLNDDLGPFESDSSTGLEFKSSLSLLLFTILKNKRFYEFATNDIRFHSILRSSEIRVKAVDFHADFEYFPIKTDYMKPLFQQLHDNCSKERYSDIIIRSDTGEKHHCYLLFLFWRSVFFSKMLLFGGEETKEYETTGEIGIVRFSNFSISLLKEYYHTGRLSKPELNFISDRDILDCIRHASQFMETDFVDKLVTFYLENMIREESRDVEMYHLKNENIKRAQLDEKMKGRLYVQVFKALENHIKKYRRFMDDRLLFLETTHPETQPKKLTFRQRFPKVRLSSYRDWTGKIIIPHESYSKDETINKLKDRLREAVKIGSALMKKQKEQDLEIHIMKETLKKSLKRGMKLTKKCEGLEREVKRLKKELEKKK